MRCVPGAISWAFLTEAPTDGMTGGGIMPAIVGTLCLMLGSALFAFPVGVISGIYMNEYAPKGVLVNFIRMMTNDLSGGQQQRLCIARAMAVEPTVLLMDEPASALDPISTSKVEELICELSGKTTVVIVTHSMQQAARVSSRTAFFYLGELVEYGNTKKIFTNPEKEATQNYITGRFG